jgi:PAS domain S-box-containing protein
MTEPTNLQPDAGLKVAVPAASLESILCTEELVKRPSRRPDYDKENSALVALVAALAASPRTILQTLADRVLEVLSAGSAGLSLLTKDEKRFYWAAIAGAWQPHLGGGTPRDFGPCGDVLDRNNPMLFTHWERRYPYLNEAMPLAEEGLLVPFYVSGRAVGTIWVIAHSTRRKFDAEDLRLLQSMGRFASAAYQAVEAIDELKLEISARESAEAELRKLTNSLEVQVRVRTEELESRNKQLRESERSLRLAIDGIPGLVGILAPNGDVVTVNRKIFEYCGQSLEELRDWRTNGTVHQEDLPRVAEVFTRSIASGIPYQLEQRLRRFDGQYRWFINRGVPIRNDSGHIVRWCVLLTDIEDRTQAQARLQQMQSDFAHMNRVSVMGELAASLSHEIAQPIASARNNARAAQNFLEVQPPDLGEVREALACVVCDADRVGDIIDRIREQMKKALPRKERFDLNPAIIEVIALAQSMTLRNGVSVQTRLTGGLLLVLGDRVQLQQVLLNLILNAAEAMSSVEEGARDLLISAKGDQTGVVVAVHDSGPGIDPEHLDRVFEAFYTTKSSGTGMGLSICQSIIHAHGGKLWAEANEPRGAVFQFTLPAAEEGELTNPLQARERI